MNIELLQLEDYDKCNNIWDMEKQKELADKFYQELLSGNRMTYICKDGDEFISLPFTTYVVPIVDVLKGTEYQTGKGKDGKTFDFTSIHSDTRGYSSVSRSYFGNHTDIENATNGIIRRTLKRLDDTTYRVGNTDSEADLLVVGESTTTEKPKLTL